MTKPVDDIESLARRMTEVAEIVGSPGHPTDTEALRVIAEQSFASRSDLAAAQRQTAALAAAGDPPSRARHHSSSHPGRPR